MTKLKDCPFCGKDVPIDEARVFEAEDIGGWLAGCCAQTWGETREEAIAAWNTRSMTNTEAVEALNPEYHYIDAFRIIREQSKEDASHAALAKAVSKFVADEVAIALSPTAKTEPSAAGLEVTADEIGMKWATLPLEDARKETVRIIAALSAPTREREMLDLLAICREWLEPDAAYTMATRTEVFARIDNLLNEGSGQ